MFELPDAKRVRREDLFNDGDSTRPSSPDLEAEAAMQARLRAKLSNLISVDFGSPTEETKAPEPDEIEDEGVLKDQIRDTAEPEFEFRLFSSTAPQKIVLAPADGTGKIDENGSGIVEPRPLSYYIRGELSPEQREQFAAAAVTAADILQGAKQRAWGLEVPWRVTKITIGPSSSGDQKGGGNQTGGNDGIARGKKRKGKLGKKARIATRTKQKALLELEKQKMTKEEHLKEKRKRLNREKKLKRRQKEKEKKAASAGGVGTGIGEMKVGGDGDESMSEGES